MPLVVSINTHRVIQESAQQNICKQASIGIDNNVMMLTHQCTLIRDKRKIWKLTFFVGPFWSKQKRIEMKFVPGMEYTNSKSRGLLARRFSRLLVPRKLSRVSTSHTHWQVLHVRQKQAHIDNTVYGTATTQSTHTRYFEWNSSFFFFFNPGDETHADLFCFLKEMFSHSKSLLR